MKGNKKILVAIVLLLLISISFTTYAIYRSSVTGSGSIRAAKWSVKVDDTDIESTSLNLNFTYDDITWASTHYGYNKTIAPGDSGTLTIPVDATGSEVDVLLEAAINTASANLPTGMTASVTSGTNGKQTIAYSTVTDAMKTNVVITLTWSGDINDGSSKDTTDKQAQNTTFTIPVTLTARQKLATD